MIPLPVIGLLDSTPTRQHRTGRVDFVDQLPGWPGWTEELPAGSDKPLMQPHEAVAAGVARVVARAGDVPVE
jgi:hypothetical protein